MILWSVVTSGSIQTQKDKICYKIGSDYLETLRQTTNPENMIIYLTDFLDYQIKLIRREPKTGQHRRDMEILQKNYIRNIPIEAQVKNDKYLGAEITNKRKQDKFRIKKAAELYYTIIIS